jgi:AcrR family transcriptional regulator
MGRRALVTHEQVLKAAREVFSERGFEGATLTHIASRLGISPAAILRHAPTKEALFSVAFSSSLETQELPMQFMEKLDGTEDPRKVLRQLAERFMEEKLGEVIAQWMRSQTVVLPFDPTKRPTPPQRGLAIVESYFRRAKKRGRMKLRDPRAAALAFMGSIHSYVFLHRILHITDPPHPFERYLDTLIDIWTDGAIRPQKRKS